MPFSDLLTKTDFSLETMLVSIFLGLIVALCILMYNRFVPGKIIRFLISNQIHSEENAVTLEQAGCARNRLIAFSLRDGSMLRKLVVCIPSATEGITEKGKTILKHARFYLPEDKCSRAELAYNNNGTSVFTVLLTVLIFLAMMLLVGILTPNLIQMLKNFLNSLKSA